MSNLFLTKAELGDSLAPDTEQIGRQFRLAGNDPSFAERLPGRGSWLPEQPRRQ
jgi:hypothetical protein